MGQHVNVFNKGMHKDNNILNQPEGTYRHMVNCDLISQDGNNYVVKDCHGNVLTFTINTRYNDLPSTLDLPPTPIAFISFPDELIVLSTNAEGIDPLTQLPIGGYGEVGKINYQNYGEGVVPINVTGNYNAGYVPLYHHPDLNFSKLKRVDGFGFDENTQIRRIYWTDNFNEPRVLNVGDPIFTNYINLISFVNGTTYMVVEGVIQDNAVGGLFYGPTTGVSVATFPTNIFTYDSTTMGPFTDVNGPNPTAKVIEYYPLELIDFAPSRSLATMEFSRYGSGSVLCGSKVYFHRLYSSASGIATVWSYASAPIHVGTENSVLATPTNAYFDFTGGGSTTVTLNSGRSVFIAIDGIDQNFDRIQVACAEFDQIKDVPRQITIVVDDLITSDSMIVEHTGAANLGDLTLSDITLFPASIETCKTMTTNKNYILIGNIREREELTDFSTTGITISQIRHKMPVHESENGAHAAGGQFCANILSYNSVSPSTVANPSIIDGIAPYTQWVVTAGVAIYNGIFYGPGQIDGEVFEGVPGIYGWVDFSFATVRPCVSRNKYTTFAGPYNKPDWIEFNQNTSNNAGDWSYKNPAVASHVKGLWSAQTYRYGILFFDLKGSPFFVRWIGDFTTDTIINNPLMENIQVNPLGDFKWYINQNGVNISGITIPPSVIDKISGFSIVRAERDGTIVSQGMLMQVGSTGAAPGTGTVFPLPSPNVANCDAFANFSLDKIYTYVCPDELVEFPMVNYVAGNGLSTSHWVKPRNLFGFNMTSSSDGFQAMEAKYFEELVAETNVDPDRSYNILALKNVNENDTTLGFGLAANAIQNFTSFQGALTNPTDGTCFGAGVPDLNSSQAICGKRTLIEVNETIYAYNQYLLIAYANIATPTPELNYKMMANVTVDKASLYGGQGAASLANTLYISTGHFQPITAAVKADVFDGTNYVFNNVEIYGGDCFACLIDYGHSLFDSSLANPVPFPSHSWGIKFACQCNSNYDLRRGRTSANNRMNPAVSGLSYNPALLEGFSYNKGYSSEGIEFTYPALPLNSFNEQWFKFRIRYAGAKVANELFDSFRTFLVGDRKDMDGQGGEINNLKTKDGRTFVWQNRIISTVPILEREVIAGSSGTPTALGTGGVVDRFDPVNSYFGNQHQWGLTETEYGFAWFDMRRKAVVVLDTSAGIGEVSFIEGLETFFNEVFVEINQNLTVDSPVLNSPTFAETSDRPLVGTGITGVFDPKTKMTYLTFKFNIRTLIGVDEFSQPVYSYINKDFTIGYYHAAKMFIGFYDWFPCIAHNHNQIVLSANNPKNRDKFYGTGMLSTDFVIGDTVSLNNVEYICTSPVTISAYPGDGTTNPDTVFSAFWTALNQTNQLWVHNQPASLTADPAGDYLYNMFFGKVVNNELEFVVNPKTQNPFNVTHGEQKGNNVNITDLTITSEYQTASDNSISATSKFFKWIYDRITFSYPLSTTGRLADSYLKVNFLKKNWTTNPTIITTSVKILQYVKNYFQEKR